MLKKSGLALVLATVFLQSALQAEVKLSVLTSIGYTGLDRQSKINSMFRGDDPFNPIRVVVFGESWINPRLGVFLEFLWDQGKSMSGSDTKPRVNGAYAVAKVTESSDALILKIGMIPSPFGVWAPRSYADRNPLVGLPLMYHYRTPVSNGNLSQNADEALERKHQDVYGLPIVYDACWDNGVEALGFASGGKFEYHLAVTKASISSPSAYMNDGVQVIGRVRFSPAPGLKFGFSAEHGSYLSESATGLPQGVSLRSVNQKALALDFALSAGHTEIQSELVHNWWENPNLEKDLSVTCGYVELKQTLFAGFYAALRYDRLSYSRLTDSAGARFDWGYDVRRVESGAGYHITRGAMVKAVWQHNTLEDEENVDLLCTQLVLTF